MDCRGWCAFSGTLLMIPLLRSVERGAAQEVAATMPWWAWLIIIGVALLAIGWWALSLRPGSRREVHELEAQLEHEEGAGHGSHHGPAHAEASAPPTAEVPPEREEDPEEEPQELADPQEGEFGEVVPDDLTLIEGIGPKIAGYLYEAGIRSYAQLAEADGKELKNLLEANGLQMHDPASWPQQAALARDGENKKLRELQEQLKGGRGAGEEAA